MINYLLFLRNWELLLYDKCFNLFMQKQDDSLLEDVWTLVRAGRVQEACDLCRSAGQVWVLFLCFVLILQFFRVISIILSLSKPWRAASLSPFGGLNLFPSGDALVKNEKNRTLQAIELESGIGHQWQLWKWASYCASEVIFKWINEPSAFWDHHLFDIPF